MHWQDRLDHISLKGDDIDLRAVAMHFKCKDQAGVSMWKRSLNVFVRDLSSSELKSIFYQYTNDPLHQSYTSSKTCTIGASSDDKWSELEGFIQWFILEHANNQPLLVTDGKPDAVPADTRSTASPKIQEPPKCSGSNDQPSPEHDDDAAMSIGSDDERVPEVSGAGHHVNAADLDSDYEADDGHKYPSPPDSSFPNINHILDSAVEATLIG